MPSSLSLQRCSENFAPSPSRCLDKLEPSARSINPPASRQGLHFLIFRLADKHGRAHASVYYGAEIVKGMTQMLARRLVRAGAGGLAAAIIIATAIDVATAQSSVYQATLAEPNQKTPEVSTEEVRRVLADGSAILVDARKRSEYVAGHIAAIAGLVIHEAQSIPEPGQTFTFHGFRFRVLRREKNRITALRITTLSRRQPVEGTG
jgi:Transporter associated domain